jgi:uncharacterized repeat protein (TIGR01451 family)
MRPHLFAVVLLLTLAPAMFAQSADLTVQITDNPDPVVAEAPLTYTIAAINNGPGAAVNASLQITYSSDASLNDIDAPAGWTCGPPAGTTITCTNASFGVGTDNLTLELIAPEVPGTPMSVSATISSATPDPAPGNNSDTEATAVGTPPSLTGTKSISSGGQFTEQNVVYTIVITHSGAAPINDVVGHEFTDNLPSTLTLISATASSGTVVADIPNNRVTWNGGFAIGQSVTITITALVESSAAGVQVLNVGVINYDRIGDGQQNTTAFTNAVTFTPAAAAAPAGAPTVSEWGLMAMAALLAALALMKIRT